jgi:ribosome-associated protein
MIRITDDVVISDEELRFTASRSGGPGGQNVNKVSTRVTVWFDVGRCPALSREQKQRIASRLATRMNNAGELRVISQQTRSQVQNRELAVTRLVELLREALRTDAPRVETRVPRRVEERRRQGKKERGALKRLRSTVKTWED